MATDPICGMYVDESTSSLVREREGRKYYFCSASCKLQFEKPEMEIKNLKASIAVAWPFIRLSKKFKFNCSGLCIFTRVLLEALLACCRAEIIHHAFVTTLEL